ncbi:hypothetical protein KFE25_007735 [Diacronema lutheri]|uniref:Protein-S-isoprenylcysteine O-methyltransferase n=2 Tax=Diacronema lutheri TaxID=2081491 RepID=A0A8J5XVI6_DIALT|nr:hypothetical protein KFE25_007735 [Diacronema lutheri]
MHAATPAAALIALAMLSSSSALAMRAGADQRPPLRRKSATNRGQLGGKVVVWPPPWVPDVLADSLEADGGARRRQAHGGEVPRPAAASSAMPYRPLPSSSPPATSVTPAAPAAPYTSTAQPASSSSIAAARPPSVFELIANNVVAGAKKDGKKGTVWLAAQVAICSCVAGGDVPYAGDLVRVDLGTLAIIGGVLTLVLGTLELGPALSPWTLPAENERCELRTDGAYAIARHPMYAGLLLLCGGFAVLTDSATRLGLTLALAFVLKEKASMEEEALAAKYADYGDYALKVSTRFFPFIY